MLITLALAHMGFIARFAHLQGDERLAFLPISQENFLHIKLVHVDNPAKGRHNRIFFASAELSSTDRLPNKDVIRDRLVKRFPAVVLGYTVVDSVDSLDSQRVTTFTHRFAWPRNDVVDLETRKLTALLQISEWILQMEARLASTA